MRVDGWNSLRCRSDGNGHMSRNTPWNRVTAKDLEELDLSRFLDGRNPYGDHDDSIYRAYEWGKRYFEETISERVGFVGGRVLDLLSGVGRWVPFLAEVNEEVVALERMPECVELAKNYCDHFGVRNASFMAGDISRVEELADESFDYVWIWSGLQYVDRAYTLNQVNRLLVPGGKVLVGAYNSTGIMLEHLNNGARQGTVFEGASQWALKALAEGADADGNPNFTDLESCERLCQRFGLALCAVAPQHYLDATEKSGRKTGWEDAPRVDAYFRTVEFVAEKPRVKETGGQASGFGAADIEVEQGGLLEKLMRLISR